MLQNNKTNARVVSPCISVSQTAIIYFLGLKKIFLISSLKSVITTAITAMKRLKSSIMDSCKIKCFHPKPNLIAKKKDQFLLKELSQTHYKQVVKLLVHLPNGLN